ncbi:MAG: methionyl-tRNA formyltransferase [Anaerolineaceae bacterium]|nr:methionyl-tRNA formyltransferase [Anaerolineaceae bacterium]
MRILAEHTRVVGVVTQPDRPAGRGRVLTPPPVKMLAQSLGIEVIQPEKLREPEAQTRLKEWAPDLIVVTAFGQILRKSVLELPSYGCINVHASLLPRWRGAAPIQSAILHGDAVSGATIMLMDPGIDTGPILAQRQADIFPGETAGQLSQRLAELGANLLIDTLPRYLSGEIQPQGQEEALSTYAPMIAKKEGLLNLNQPADQLERRIRAFQPWPGAFMEWQGLALKIHRAHTAPCTACLPGQRCIIDDLPAVATPDGCLVFDEIQPAGKRVMPGQEFLRGSRQWAA